eukprot:117840-Pyramimonas_sp.AAC.1
MKQALKESQVENEKRERELKREEDDLKKALEPSAETAKRDGTDARRESPDPDARASTWKLGDDERRGGA